MEKTSAALYHKKDEELETLLTYFDSFFSHLNVIFVSCVIISIDRATVKKFILHLFSYIRHFYML